MVSQITKPMISLKLNSAILSLRVTSDKMYPSEALKHIFVGSYTLVSSVLEDEGVNRYQSFARVLNRGKSKAVFIK